MRKISIRERLILYFVLLSLISITIVSLFSIFEAKKGIRERAFSQLILLRDLRKEQIEAYYNTCGKELSTLAASEGMLEALRLAGEIGNGDISNQIILHDRQLLNLVMDERNCKSLFFIVADGSTFRFNRSGNGFILSEDSLFINTTGVSRLFPDGDSLVNYKIIEQVSTSNQPNIMIASRVICSDDQLCAAVILDLNTETIHEIIFNESPGTGLGRTGEAYLAGTDGFMRTPSRFIPGSVMNVRVNSFGFNEALAGNEGTSIYNDYRGIKVLGAFGTVKISGYKQVILAEIDVSEAMVPLVVIRNDILIVSSLLLLVIFVITWFLAFGITRPLVRLKNAVNYISAGNYDQQLEIESDDEIGDLTLAFNTMSTEINFATKELKEKEESLRHFYEATLDGIVLHHEGRMVLYNSTMLRLTGYFEDEFEGFGIKDILMTTKEMLCDKKQSNEMYETVLIRKDKTSLPVEVQESCVEYNGKNVRASVIRDISARKKMEEELLDERNKRIRAVFDGKDTEQQRLSRELHDGLGQQLIAGKLILESSLYDNEQNLKVKVIEVQKLFDQIISDIRKISHDLSPSILSEFGLKAAMENVCRNIIKATGLNIGFHFDLEDNQPGDLASNYLFRIAQESLNNIQIHSGATDVNIVIKTDQYGIMLEIEDNGCGFDLKNVSGSGGNGLYNIRERVNILNGQLNIKSRPGKGTRIQVRIPAEDAFK